MPVSPHATRQSALIDTRWMLQRDLESILEIERDCFPESPWTKDDFLRCLRQSRSLGHVVEAGPDDELAGYMLYELTPRSLHLLNFAVARRWQHRGIGSQMIERLKAKLSLPRPRITLEIVETSLAAQCFFRHHGFRATGVLREFYADCDLDAYFMQYRLPTNS